MATKADLVVALLEELLKKLTMNDTQPTEPAISERIRINHCDSQLVDVLKIDVLKRLLITDRKPVVFFGESDNFTFTMAFAAMLQAEHRNENPWETITTTCYRPLSDHCRLEFEKVKLNTIKSAICNGRELGIPDSNTIKRVKILYNLRSPDKHPYELTPNDTTSIATAKQTLDHIRDDSITDVKDLEKLIILRVLTTDPGQGRKTAAQADKVYRGIFYNVDVINTTPVDLRGKVAWFQCPWASGSRTETRGLVLGFFNHMAHKQAQYILIGIANQFPYTKSYDLAALLNLPTDYMDDAYCAEGYSGGSFYLQRGYDFLGADNTLVKQLLQYGYRHTGEGDIHKQIIQDHITLVFKRR